MASHQVAIAKASLAAGLLRPDPTSVPRDEITALHSTLDRALSHCSPANIQRCKAWLLEYVVASSNRVALLAKYLVVLSGSLDTGSDGKEKEKQAVRPSAKRKRLHILYLLNDLFHHTKYHASSTAAFSALCGSLQPHMVELLSYAACYDREKNPKHHRRLSELLDIWQEHGYFGADYVGKLREVVANSAVSGPVTTSSNTPGAESIEPDRKARDGPYVMPSTHGDPSTPYYDLPAGNLIPHIIPNSTVPLQPDMIKPLHFVAGPADGKLVSALKVFLADVDRIYSPGSSDQKDGEIVDIDELGQRVIRDEITGDILEGETYYGWSRSFCQQMKKRNARDRSASRSRSRSRSPPKRRRYSSASDDSRYRSSRSRSRSRSPRRGRYDSRSRSRSRSYSPAPPAPAPAQTQSHPQHPPPQHNPYNQPPPPPPYPPQHQPHQMHYPPAPNAFPPPPPPNYQGAWPPPPPPQMPNFPPPFQHMHQMQPGAPLPPPPPGSYGYPPGGRGWNQHPPPPPPSGRGWR
ncbi:RNA polymerase II-binding domain-containing protein [Aspergillus mulundensis]|uniref:CID domain-containing protein n=1 Tax=Aspergillus mulundensis TaxID=1810919 RepID=A0A3D8T3H2_9EURO|nr:Uncharacterized protein DSM5745_00415 [Aspergillus mulundensis]RDW93093.1 Uncharacterized protein DSM5745_00415 [Aspergillus mulundensis]